MIVVTGASGHVGANLVRELLADGQGPIRVVVREDARAVEGLDVERVPGDVLDPESLQAAFAGAEVVYHLAARISIVGDPDGAVRRINEEGPRNVTRACREQGVERLVHVSSIHAHHPRPHDAPIDETRPLLTDDCGVGYAYDRSKAAGQRVVLAAVADGLDAVIVNPTAVLGPHDYKGSRMGQVLCALYRGRLPGLVTGGFDWVDARDVARLAMAAADRGRTGEAYLAGGVYLTLPAFATQVAEVSGRRAPWLVTPHWLAAVGLPFAALYARISGSEPLFTWEALGALREYHEVSHAKAARKLGYAPRPLRETLADTFAWYREQGALT